MFVESPFILMHCVINLALFLFLDALFFREIRLEIGMLVIEWKRMGRMGKNSPGECPGVEELKVFEGWILGRLSYWNTRLLRSDYPVHVL